MFSWIFNLFFQGSMKKFNHMAKKKTTRYLKFFLSTTNTKVAIKFLKVFFFSAENWLGAERVKQLLVYN